MKLVSIIIPIYNVEKYIEECLVSVLNQTLKDIEIICVNDGTLDNSMEIIERYADTDDRIVIVNKENGGLSSARNAGLRAATGKYVYFLDSDDYILEDALEKLCAIAEENELDSIFFDADSFFESEALAQKHQSYAEYYHRDNSCKEILPGQEFLRVMVENGDWRPSACLQMNKRNLLLNNNLWFEEGIIHEDNLFSLQVSLHSKAAAHISERFYQRRVREDSIMTSRSALRSANGYFECILKIIPEIDKALVSEKYRDVYYQEVVRMKKAAVGMLKRLPVEELEQFQLDNVKKNMLFELMIKEYAMQDISYKTVRENLIKENKKLKKIQENLTKANKKLKKELKKIKNSRSYRLGQRLTALPRKVKKLMKRIRCNRGFKTKVSVIMPVYNVEKYLPACLESLLNQTLKKIEIICVDDQSTDNSYAILQKYAAKDNRVKLFRQNHEGAGAARNVGMKVATGEYLLFLDADDLFDKQLCEVAYTKAIEKNAEVVLFGAQRMDMQTGNVEKMGWVLRSGETQSKELFSAEDIAEKVFQITTNCPWSKLFKAEFIKKHKLQFQNTKHANDAFFVRTAIAMAKRITIVDKVLVTYRYNDGTNTQSVKHLAPLEFYKAFLAVKERLEREGQFEKFKKSYVNWALTESLFNYRTMKTEIAKDTIREKLLAEGFEKMGISQCSEEIFYNKNLFSEYCEFVNQA